MALVACPHMMASHNWLSYRCVSERKCGSILFADRIISNEVGLSRFLTSLLWIFICWMHWADRCTRTNCTDHSRHPPGYAASSADMSSASGSHFQNLLQKKAQFREYYFRNLLQLYFNISTAQWLFGHPIINIVYYVKLHLLLSTWGVRKSELNYEIQLC